MIDETPISTLPPRLATPRAGVIANQEPELNSLEQIITEIDQALVAQHEPGPTTPFAAGSNNPAGRPARLTAQGKYIVFSLAEARYAVPINQVVEVGDVQHITPVPNAPVWVLGVTNLRGDIISVVDCGAFLNLHEKSIVEMSSLCIVRNKERDLTTSLMVDRIEGMMNLSAELMPVPENTWHDEVVPYLQGIYEHQGQLLNILNLEGLLASMKLTT